MRLDDYIERTSDVVDKNFDKLIKVYRNLDYFGGSCCSGTRKKRRKDIVSSICDTECHGYNGSGKRDEFLDFYFKEISRFPLLLRDEERKLFEKMQRGDRKAREHLIKSNLRLVVSNAKMYIGMGLSFSDLIGEGNVGLMKALEKFDLGFGTRFSTYAIWWINQGIRRAITDQPRLIKRPDYLVPIFVDLKKIRRKITEIEGKEPTLDYVLEKYKEQNGSCLSSNVLDYIKLGWKTGNILSLDCEFGSDGSILIDSIDTRLPELGQSLEKKDEFLELKNALRSIGGREAKILRRRYFCGKTLSEIANEINLSRERVRQIESVALIKLKRSLLRKRWMEKRKEAF